MVAVHEGPASLVLDSAMVATIIPKGPNYAAAVAELTYVSGVSVCGARSFGPDLQNEKSGRGFRRVKSEMDAFLLQGASPWLQLVPFHKRSSSGACMMGLSLRAPDEWT